jgi:hypothetical protein
VATNESLRKTLEHYLQQKSSKLEEVRQLDLIIARLSRDLGETPAEPQLAESPGDSMPEWRENVELQLLPNVRPDDFFGMTYTAAAKAYLDKVGHAVSMDQIVDALGRGGCPVGGKDPKKTLYISLIRDVRNFVNIPGRSGYLGLRKFYPNLKAANRDDKEPKAKRRRGRRKTVEAKAKAKKAMISAKEKSRPAVDQTAQKGEAM